MSNKKIERPTIEQLESELNRVKHNSRYRTVLKSTIYTLITVAALAVLVATFWLPILKTSGSSMSPTFEDGEIVVSVKTTAMKTGDVVVFYYNNKILMKRFIAGPGDWVNLDEQGGVYVNDKLIEEPYIVEKDFGKTNIDLPYQVPDGKIFVLGDNRAVSLDSRNSVIGCVSQEQLAGKIIMRIWPLNKIKIF